MLYHDGKWLYLMILLIVGDMGRIQSAGLFRTRLLSRVCVMLVVSLRY